MNLSLPVIIQTCVRAWHFFILVYFIQNKLRSKQEIIFKISDLTNIYKTRLYPILDNDSNRPKTHITRLREKIEEYSP